jgi:hypothetical protein
MLVSVTFVSESLSAPASALSQRWRVKLLFPMLCAGEPNVASWNRFAGWLRRLDGLREAA